MGDITWSELLEISPDILRPKPGKKKHRREIGKWTHWSFSRSAQQRVQADTVAMGRYFGVKKSDLGLRLRAGMMSKQAEECVQNAKGLRGLKGWGQTSQGCMLVLKLWWAFIPRLFGDDYSSLSAGVSTVGDVLLCPYIVSVSLGQSWHLSLRVFSKHTATLLSTTGKETPENLVTGYQWELVHNTSSPFPPKPGTQHCPIDFRSSSWFWGPGIHWLFAWWLFFVVDGVVCWGILF